MPSLPWYRGVENWLLEHGRLPIAFGLIVMIVISAWLLLAVSVGQQLVAAAAWVTYMFMP